MNVDKIRKALELVCEELAAAFIDADSGEGSVDKMNARRLNIALQHAQECTFWVRWLAEPLMRSQEPPPATTEQSFEYKLAKLEERFGLLLNRLEIKAEAAASGKKPKAVRRRSTR